MRLLILLGAIAAGVWSQVPSGKSAVGRDPQNLKFYKDNLILNIYKFQHTIIGLFFLKQSHVRNSAIVLIKPGICFLLDKIKKMIPI